MKNSNLSIFKTGSSYQLKWKKENLNPLKTFEFAREKSWKKFDPWSQPSPTELCKLCANWFELFFYFAGRKHWAPAGDSACSAGRVAIRGWQRTSRCFQTQQWPWDGRATQRLRLHGTGSTAKALPTVSGWGKRRGEDEKQTRHPARHLPRNPRYRRLRRLQAARRR